MNLKELFATHLEQNLPQIQSFHPFFNQALSAMLKAGGKHFRARLFLAVVKAYKKEALDSALNAAMALEFIHTYSLIHDDLPAMDNADFRRAHPTLHKRYDEATAILVGDALNTEAFLLLSRLRIKPELRLKLIETLSFNAGLSGMVLGQALDCFFENKKLSLEELKFLHTHKTAKLIAAALKMGAELCELEDVEKFYTLGLKLGLIFQINDDIIDATSTKEESGKPTGADTHKNSFVNLLGLDGAMRSKEELLRECDFSSFKPEFVEELQQLIKKHL